MPSYPSRLVNDPRGWLPLLWILCHSLNSWLRAGMEHLNRRQDWRKLNWHSTDDCSWSNHLPVLSSNFQSCPFIISHIFWYSFLATTRLELESTADCYGPFRKQEFVEVNSREFRVNYYFLSAVRKATQEGKQTFFVRRLNFLDLESENTCLFFLLYYSVTSPIRYGWRWEFEEGSILVKVQINRRGMQFVVRQRTQ